MPKTPNFRIIASWPTGVPMVFSVVVSNEPTTPSTYPAPGTTYAAIGVPCDPTRVGQYGAYEFVTMRPSNENNAQEWFFAAPLTAQETFNYTIENNEDMMWARLTQTWLIKRSAFTDADQASPASPPALGRAWSTVHKNLKRTTVFGPEMEVLDSLYVIFEVIYEDYSVDVFGTEIDPLTGATMLMYKRRIPNSVGAASVGISGGYGVAVQGDGLYAEVQPESDKWSIQIWRYATALTSSPRAIDVVVNYSWPPVLNSIRLYAVGINTFPGARYLVNPVWTSGGYDGPCNAIINESWSSSIPTAAATTQMQPTPVEYDGMFYNVRTRSCLHPAIQFTELAVNSPYVSNFTNTFVCDATSPTTWPSTIVAKVDVENYRGGFIKRELVIYKPGS